MPIDACHCRPGYCWRPFPSSGRLAAEYEERVRPPQFRYDASDGVSARAVPRYPMYLVPKDGSGPVEALCHAPPSPAVCVISPDGSSRDVTLPDLFRLYTFPDGSPAGTQVCSK